MLQTSAAGRGSTLSLGPSPETIVQAYSIPAIYRYRYNGFESLRDIFTRIWADLPNNRLRYIAIIGFNSENLLELERRGLRDSLPKFTALVDDNSETMIVKFMPGVLHDRISRTLFYNILSRIERLGMRRQIVMSGSGRMSFPSGVHKEPDEQIKPASRNNLHDYPTFVIEVGVSETLRQLRQDARLWHVNTNGRTKIVLLISVDIHRKILRFERWQDSPANVQQLEYHHNGAYLTGAPLVIPADLLFDSVPPNLPAGEISFDHQTLLDFGAAVFFDS
ncbi:hypothetical protein DTO021D3_2671 [Paecilomyces variotii]|nr:hypothetical protein DTO032I3_4520 [Paecilomyces variotii]KAJ9280451.1 hypothetical protein DTO021D3_2671 [Paecilomyces variotii]KAJ9346913.1 hypothetical protein DTO027B6_480 [Paecilomyces variotii]KAJ9393524.1 hypothetical protein DTO032I4_295 [Paecilomyces variotii]